MAKSIEELDLTVNLSRNELKDVVKSEAGNIHIKDIMLAASFLRDDAQYMPKSYRDDYIERFSKSFFSRVKEIKEDKKDYPGDVNRMDLVEFLELLDEQSRNARTHQEKCFVKIARIISTYTTFVCQEPIHPLGTRFPGGFVLHLENSKYLCPVKQRQMKNPSALCKFCVSIQDKKVIN
ncbi:MAG: DUF2115 domain-containing protein [Methanobacterium sp. ERen5]|nr:MAG: DUF2115 domain-containing protein [Methanobacterium sp. ERen5]